MTTINRKEEQKVWGNLTQKQKRGFRALAEEGTVKDGKFYDRNGNDQSDRVQITMNVTDKQFQGLITRDEFQKFQHENGGFVFAYFAQLTTMDGRFPELTQSDLARVMFIGTYTGWGDGQLKHGNGVVIDRQGLEKLIGISRNKFAEFYDRIVQCGIIAEGEEGGLFMNPTVFYRGDIKSNQYETDDLAYTRLFRKTAQDLYKAFNGRSIKQLAVIYALLPFINFNYNIICYNPTESVEEDIDPIPVAKLATLLGYKNTRELLTIIDKIRYEGDKVFGYFGTDLRQRGKMGVIVNPQAVYAGSAETLKTTQFLFTLSKRLG